MSNITNYTPEVMSNVAGVLARIEGNEGKITKKFLQSEIERLKGQWASEVISVALLALGREAAISGMVASPAQIEALTRMAKERNEYVIGKIKVLREAREKAKEETVIPQPQPEITIEVIDLDDESDPPFELKDDVMNVSEAAVELGVSEQRVRAMLGAGRFEHASKYSGVWLLNGNEVRMIAYQERKAGRPSKAANSGN